MCRAGVFLGQVQCLFCFSDKKISRSVRGLCFSMNVSGLVLPHRRELRSSILFLSSLQGGTFFVRRGGGGGGEISYRNFKVYRMGFIIHLLLFINRT